MLGMKNGKEQIKKMNSTKLDYMSLYDYLGKPAGRILGERVYKEAYWFGITPKYRFVDTKTYKGKVHLYTRAFLDYYFEREEITDIII
jgi:hypothetical protein